MSNSIYQRLNGDSVEEKQLEYCERPLTVRETKLHEQFVDDGRPLNITEAIAEFTGYRSDRAGQTRVFENGSKSVSNRFNRAYADKKYAQAMDAARALQRKLNELHTVMITLRADRINADGEGRAYVDHLNDLLDSNQYVTQRLRDSLGDRFGRLSALCAEDSGHAYIRHGLWIDNPVTRKDVQTAIDAHLKHCTEARERNHGQSTIKIRPAAQNSRFSEQLVETLAKDLVGFNDSISSSDPEERLKYRRFGAMLLASGKNQWRPDRMGMFRAAMNEGTEKYKENNIDEHGRYEGVRFEDSGEIHDPTDFGGGNESAMVEVTDVDPSDDPVKK